MAEWRPVAGLLLALVMGMMLGCPRPPQVGLRTYYKGHVGISIPTDWERKGQELVFRKKTAEGVSALIAVDELALAGSAAATIQAGRRALASTGRTIDTTRRLSLGGIGAVEEGWHGALKGGTAVRGKAVYIPGNGSVVAVLWYVPQSEWIQAEPRMDSIARSVVVR